MKKIINQPEAYVDEVLQGMTLAHPKDYKLSTNSTRVLLRPEAKIKGKVGIVSGGGFGHLPLFTGYIGQGLLDSCAVGDVFAGPAGDDVAVSLQEADFGAGTLCILGNYGGDRMTFEMQSELARMSGADIETVIVNDDVASADASEIDKRRGVAGIVWAFKIAGAAAENGLCLADIKQVTQKAIDNTRSIGVALGSCVIPQVGKPTFDLPDDEIEMGMGIHGEQGVWRGALKSADDLTDEMLERLLADLPLLKGDKITVLCNSLGATPMEELYIMFRRITERFQKLEIEIVQPLIGHYATSMEMAGASISIMKLDQELTEYLAAPADCPFWRN